MNPVRPSRRAVAGLLSVVAAASLAACSDDGSRAGDQAPSTTTRPGATPITAQRLFVQVANAGEPRDFPVEDEAAILRAVEGYVRTAMVDPLETGDPPKIDKLLAPAAQLTISDTDRAAIADAGVPPATGKITVEMPRMNLRALADKDGSIDLIGSTLNVDLTTTTETGPLTIHREGELMWLRTIDGWKLLGFSVIVQRDGAGAGDLPATGASTTAPPAGSTP